MRARVSHRSGWRGEARALLAEDHGVALSFHPHVGTAVEREAEIDRLLADTEVGLCFDTGHHAFWGQDPLAYMHRVGDRIGYMHLKNVDPGICGRVRAGTLGIDAAFAQGAMCPLPDGAVDIHWAVADGRLRIEWRERGGPPVTAPLRRGFGLRMIERALAADLDGTATGTFPPEGLSCVIDAPEPGRPL